MIKKVNLVLMLLLLPAILLIGCNSDENGDRTTTSSRIEVRIIEDFESLGLDVPLYYHIKWINRPGIESQLIPQILNGLTGEIEKAFEFSDYHRVQYYPIPFGDYYILPVSLGNNPYLDGETMTVGIEYFIFDQNFNQIDSFILSMDEENMDVISKVDGFRQVGQNELGEWLIYGVGGNVDRIYVYNVSTSEIIQIAQFDGFVGGLCLMSDVNKLAFTLGQGLFGFGWQEHLEFGFIDLETHEISIVHQVENALLPRLADPFDPMFPVGEALLVNITTGNDEQSAREVLLLYPLTGEVRTIPIGADDYWNLEGYGYLSTFSTNTTMDGRFILKNMLEQNAPLIDGWSHSNLLLTVELYDTQTSKVVFEYLLIDADTLALDESMRGANLIPIYENIYLIRARIFTGQTETDASIGAIRFEYIVVEIVVHDDE